MVGGIGDLLKADARGEGIRVPELSVDSPREWSTWLEFEFIFGGQ